MGLRQGLGCRYPDSDPPDAKAPERFARPWASPPVERPPREQVAVGGHPRGGSRLRVEGHAHPHGVSLASTDGFSQPGCWHRDPARSARFSERADFGVVHRTGNRVAYSNARFVTMGRKGLAGRPSSDRISSAHPCKESAIGLGRLQTVSVASPQRGDAERTHFRCRTG